MPPSYRYVEKRGTRKACIKIESFVNRNSIFYHHERRQMLKRVRFSVTALLLVVFVAATCCREVSALTKRTRRRRLMSGMYIMYDDYIQLCARAKANVDAKRLSEECKKTDACEGLLQGKG